MRKLPKLTNEHISLNSYSVMRVKLAAQVMSSSVSKVMLAYSPLEAHETARFIGLVDKFFDCFNTRSLHEAEFERNPFVAPYVNCDDHRFNFLENTFLKYLGEWEESIKGRGVNFTTGDRKKMFISEQTYCGIKTSVYALIECTKNLLRHGFQYVLSSAFNQDCLEELFGWHRICGRISTNPTVYTFGYQEKKLCLQRSLATSITPRGNTKGSKRKRDGIMITNSPLKRRKRQ